jgi:hypothetical protein
VSPGPFWGYVVMMKQNTPPDEAYKIRCPRLGHLIHFYYCRSENQGLPCFKTLQCWYDHFLVEEFMRETLTPEEWDRVFNRPPKAKIVSLIELIEQAKETKK